MRPRGVITVWAMPTILGRGTSHLPQVEEPCKEDEVNPCCWFSIVNQGVASLKLIRWTVFFFPNERLHLLVQMQGWWCFSQRQKGSAVFVLRKLRLEQMGCHKWGAHLPPMPLSQDAVAVAPSRAPSATMPLVTLRRGVWCCTGWLHLIGLNCLVWLQTAQFCCNPTIACVLPVFQLLFEVTFILYLLFKGSC